MKKMSRRIAKLVKIRFMNRLRKQQPAVFAEMRAYEAPYKPHR
jgi:hypothetical protein